MVVSSINELIAAAELIDQVEFQNATAVCPVSRCFAIPLLTG